MSSGNDVANETKVIPTTTLGTRQRFAAATAARSNKSPPTRRETRPKIRSAVFIYLATKIRLIQGFVPLGHAKKFFSLFSKMQ
jgi:hypothetical protein